MIGTDSGVDGKEASPTFKRVSSTKAKYYLSDKNIFAQVGVVNSNLSQRHWVNLSLVGR